MRAIWLSVAIIVALVTGGCAIPTADNPYPGDGGSPFREPTAGDIADPNQVFDAAKLSRFRLGVNTKREVAAALGEPTWWTTYDNGNSRLVYDFLLRGSTVREPNIAPAEFVFDSKNVLVDLNYAGSYKKFQIERGPESFAYVEALVGPESSFLDRISPATWTCPPSSCVAIDAMGGYIRYPIHITRVIAGEASHRHEIVELTANYVRAGRWTGYFLLATDRFGSVSVWNGEKGRTSANSVTPRLAKKSWTTSSEQ